MKRRGRPRKKSEQEIIPPSHLCPERRFGPLDEAGQTRVRAADAETLLLWSDRILTAQSLSEVFGE